MIHDAERLTAQLNPIFSVIAVFLNRKIQIEHSRRAQMFWPASPNPLACCRKAALLSHWAGDGFGT
jgi:hypothetical protein